MFEAQWIVDEKVHERVRATGADNFGRVVGELEKCGYIARYYEGYRTPHSNRGGLRNLVCVLDPDVSAALRSRNRSEEHTSELQSLMRISYAVFCLKKKTTTPKRQQSTTT